MKLKYISIYLFASLTLFGLSSCNDFLDKYPEEELSDASYWKTPSDAEIFVADIYRQVLPGANSGDIDGDIESDNAVHGIKWAAGNVSKGVYDPSDFGWSGDYKAIRACNKLFENIDNIPNYDETEKKKVIGEGKFLRAFIYFGLIQSFGDVPYIDKTLNIGDLTDIKRDDYKEIYKKVMEDFDYAIANLPEQWPADKYGRITKGAALAMKARVALYFKDYQVAVDASKAVIDSKQYELFDAEGTGKYAELFWESQEACSEAIFVRQFKAPEMTNYIIGWGCFPTKGWGGINPTQSLVDAFECIDGAPITSSPLYKETDPFNNRDPRLEVCVLHDGEVMYGETIKVAPLKTSGSTGIGQHNDATATGYYNQKYLDPSIDPQGAGWDMGKDWHIIRFAEVLLTYAEAKNELSGPDASVYEALNRVRTRAGMPSIQNTNATLPTFAADQETLRQRIRTEWRVEFAMEGGKRKWDIRRWGIAKEVLNAPFYGLKYKMSADGSSCELYVGEPIKLAGSRYEDHNYLMPIPQKEIDLNSKLTQNPGY